MFMSVFPVSQLISAEIYFNFGNFQLKWWFSSSPKNQLLIYSTKYFAIRVLTLIRFWNDNLFCKCMHNVDQLQYRIQIFMHLKYFLWLFLQSQLFYFYRYLRILQFFFMVPHLRAIVDLSAKKKKKHSQWCHIIFLGKFQLFLVLPTSHSANKNVFQ